MGFWEDVQTSLAVGGVTPSDRDMEYVYAYLGDDIKHPNNDDVDRMSLSADKSWLTVKFHWLWEPMYFQRTWVLVRPSDSFDEHSRMYVAFDVALYQEATREQRLLHRNAIIYGTAGHREYRTPIEGKGKFACYCGTCHAESFSIASTRSECTCYPRRLWRDWDRYTDMTALHQLANRNWWPHNAHAAQRNYRQSQWASIMKEWLRRNRTTHHSLVEEYIMEAEHQEGELDYWWQFTHPDILLKDFDIYLEAVG